MGAEDHFNTCIGFWELGIGNRTINTGKAGLSSKPCAKVGAKRMSGIVLKPSKGKEPWTSGSPQPEPLKLGFSFAETIPETTGINPKPMQYFLIQTEQKLLRL